ncbi:MAG: hypothetical protein JJU06_13390 [Ectothiorhodospiraceae bacterium]|nr:hypothetical protein [Ectothiorhodospiraceae bacterium]MCH8504086.1 hypothetical protein [Ectothiorhodospiraceae bacterium]
MLVEFVCAYAAFQLLDLLVHDLYLGRAPFPTMSEIVFIAAAVVAVAGAGAHLNSRYVMLIAVVFALVNGVTFLAIAALFAPELLNTWSVAYQSLGHWVIAVIILGGAMVIARRRKE